MGKGPAGWFYVRRNGPMAAVMTYDNGPDAFVDGRARSQVGEKIGYIDRTLKFVISARYDGAYPFEHGAAVICIGCIRASDGEHGWYEGGSWGCIDRHGRNVKPLVPLQKDQSFDQLCREN